MADGSLALLTASPRWAGVAQRHGITADDVRTVLREADRLAGAVLAPLAPRADIEGCRLDNGRVRTPKGYAEAWRLLSEGGWIAPDLPEALGGQGLPVALHTAASLALEGAAMPFLMLAGSTRAAAHCLAETEPDLAAEWSPRLASGEWSATICISEPDAGSDLGRIRTRAAQDGSTWRITGTKCWISFGDHGLTTRIGHLLLARTGPVDAGTRGLTLFLVPDRLDGGRRNGIVVERIEEKLGLHGSPTCVLRFEQAEGVMIGEEGRGLVHLFAMISRMRLQTGCQGAGVALRAAGISRAHAAERRQGGRPDAPPPPIDTHPDVRRQLLQLEGASEILRAFLLETALTLDAAREGDSDAAKLAPLLLPLAKTFGGETGFEVASGAIQVLGGAGYTREWPLERLLRDARVITIYEGTTGMQAQDFLQRRIIADGAAGVGVLLARALPEAETCHDPCAAAMPDLIRRFGQLCEEFATGASNVPSPAVAADGVLRAGWAAVSAWMTCRLLSVGHAADAARLQAHLLPSRFAVAEVAARLPDALVCPSGPPDPRVQGRAETTTGAAQ